MMALYLLGGSSNHYPMHHFVLCSTLYNSGVKVPIYLMCFMINCY